MRPMTWNKNTVTFPNVKEWASKQTKHEYYTSQEIFDGTEKRIKEMMLTVHKNRTDRESKEKESSVDPVAKKQKQQTLLNFSSRSGDATVTSFVATSSLTDPAVDVVVTASSMVDSKRMRKEKTDRDPDL